MESSHSFETPYRGEDFTWAARWLSIVFSPPVAAVGGLLLTARSLATPNAWGWALAAVLITLCPPMGYVAWLVRRGAVTDYDLRVRAQRGRPYLLTALCGASGWLVLTLGGAPPLLRGLVGALAVQVAVLMLITLVWKISLHTAAVAGLLAVCLAVFGPAAAPLAVLVPAVAWARVQLRRHTLGQTAAGALVGFLVITVGLALAG